MKPQGNRVVYDDITTNERVITEALHCKTAGRVSNEISYISLLANARDFTRVFMYQTGTVHFSGI